MNRTAPGLIALAVFLFAADAAADHERPMSVYGAADSHQHEGAGGLTLRAGAGSLYGPAFDAGQPEYAHSDGFDWENRRPFSAPHQMAMTYGLAGTLSIGLGRWALGATATAGFNATSWKSGDFSDIELTDELRGVTLGAGIRASRKHRKMRITIDALASRSSLKGSVEWNYSDMFLDDALVGDASYEYSLYRFALLGGAEFDAGPVFLFLNAGAQFLPEQRRPRTISGSFPEAHTKDPFNVAVTARVERERTETVTFDDELALAASAGVGLRF